MSGKKRLAINMIASVVSLAVNCIINFFLSPFIIENIGTEAYGYVALANNFISYTTIFTAAINSIASRYIMISMQQHKYEEANVYFNSVFISNAIMAVGFFVPAVYIIFRLEYIINVPAYLLADVRLLWVLLFACSITVTALPKFEVCFFLTNRLDLDYKRRVEANLLRLAATMLPLLLFTPKLWYIGVATLLMNLYITVSSYIYFKKLTPEIHVSRKKFSWSAVRELLSVGIWNSVNTLSQILFTGFDLLLANLFVSAVDMTFLSVAKTIPILIQDFVATIAAVFMPPMLMAYAKKNMPDFLKETNLAVKTVGFVSCIPMAGFLAFGRSFYTLWQTSLSPAEIDKVQLLSVLTVLPMLLSAFVNPLYNINTITKKLKVPVMVSLALGVLNLLVVYLLVKFTDLGVYAIAGVSSVLILLRVILFVPIYAAYVLKLRKTTFFRPLLRGFLSVAVTYALFYLVNRIFIADSWTKLIAAAAVCAVLGYFVCMLVLFDKDEKKEVLNFLKEKIHFKKAAK